MRAYANILLEDDGFENWRNLLASRSWGEIQDMNFSDVRALYRRHGILRAFLDRQRYLREVHAVAVTMKMKIIQLYCSEPEEGMSVKCIDLSGNELAVVPLHPTTVTALALRSAVVDALADDADAASFQILLPDGRILNDVDDTEPVHRFLGLGKPAAAFHADAPAPALASPPEAAASYAPALAFVAPTIVTAAAPAASPTSQDIQTLMSMGFERSKAETTLRAKGCLDSAIESLLTPAPASGAPTTAPAGSPPRQDIQILMSMGFERSKAEAALRAKGCLDGAIDSLLNPAPAPVASATAPAAALAASPPIHDVQTLMSI